MSKQRVTVDQAIAKATDLFVTFHAREPDADVLMSLQWPGDGLFGIFDKGENISYLSDKWTGEWEAYKHPHPRINTTILVPLQKGMRRHPGRYLRPLALTYLGYALDVQLERPKSKPEFLNFMEMVNKPYLAWDPNRRALIIIDQDTYAVYVLTSPDLRVTERGIEG